MKVEPVTVERLDDLADLFGSAKVTTGCWCMWFIDPAKEVEGRWHDGGNRRAFERLAAEVDPPPPGRDAPQPPPIGRVRGGAGRGRGGRHDPRRTTVATPNLTPAPRTRTDSFRMNPVSLLAVIGGAIAFVASGAITSVLWVLLGVLIGGAAGYGIRVMGRKTGEFADAVQLEESTTRDALYHEAQELGIEGRSNMDKSQLVAAIAAERARH